MKNKNINNGISNFFIGNDSNLMNSQSIKGFKYSRGLYRLESHRSLINQVKYKINNDNEEEYIERTFGKDEDY